jgi:hypothetical protein
VSSERLGEDEARRVAISANKGKSEREPRISLANICGHNFPLELAQPASLDGVAIQQESAQDKLAALVSGIEGDSGQV